MDSVQINPVFMLQLWSVNHGVPITSWYVHEKILSSRMNFLVFVCLLFTFFLVRNFKFICNSKKFDYYNEQQKCWDTSQ